jgi:hypothetical protein
MKTIKLTDGTMDQNDNLDGWIITSATATAQGAEDVELELGDRIDINGVVRRNGDMIARI